MEVKMVMYSEDGKQIGNFEKHAEWVKDDVDKILNKILTGNREYTMTVLKKIVLEELVKIVAKGTTLSEKLSRLVEIGILKARDKETTIKLFSLKESSHNNKYTQNEKTP